MSTNQKPAAGRRRALYAAVGVAAGLGGAGLAWWRFAPAEIEPAAEAAVWGLSFETPAGGQLAMQGLRGRPLLLNFWATWCPPCVEEMPLLDAFYKEHSPNGWQVLGLAVDKREPVQSFLVRQPMSFPIALAGFDGLALSKMLGNRAGGLPFSVLFGADGAILNRKIGKLTSQDLAQWRALK